MKSREGERSKVIILAPGDFRPSIEAKKCKNIMLSR
jgi:hypothetical protein